MTTRYAIRTLLSGLLLLLAVQFTVTAQTVKPFVTVDAARYQPAVAPDSIVSGFTVAITTQNYFATEDVDSVTPGIQLPTTLGGLRVLVNNRLAELLYVGPNQINYVVPAATEVDATATVVVTNEQGTVLAQGDLYMAASSLNIFTQNQQGTGSPAAAFTADGITYTQVNNGDGSVNNVPPGNYLVLFGTGVREGRDIKAFIGGLEAQVDYAGAQPTYVALDQINIRIPESVTGQGLLDLFITDGLTTSNTITINVGGNPEAPSGAPVITTFNNAETYAGQLVTVTGSQFPTTLAEASVKLGAVSGQVVSTSATAMTFIVPYGAATDKVTIGNTAGTRKSSANLTIRTSISGTIMDAQGAPVSGVNVSIANASIAASTDASGRFLLADVPRGIAQVDIDTSLLPASLGLPTLTFNMVVTEGRDNEIGYPIYLPAGLGTTTFLNNVRWHENDNGVLTARVEADPVVIEHDGLRLEIPSTVTFPKGVREPRVGLTRLPADIRLPAPLPAKVFPSVVALITPIGTTFGAKGEGLATLTFPNPDKFAAGTVLDLYALRLNVAPPTFVKKGTATVDASGEKIVARGAIDFATIWFIGAPIDSVTFTNVVGQVVDSNDKPVAKARVFVRGRSALTDQNGKFEIKGVRAKNDDELRVDAMFFTPAGNRLHAFKLVKAVVPGNTDAGTIKFPAPPPLSILLRPMEARMRPGATIDMTVVLSRKFSVPVTINLMNEDGVKLDISPASITFDAGQTEASFKVKGDTPGRGTVVAKLAAAVDDATPDNTRKGFAIVYVMNPAPVLTSINPTSGAPGSTFTLVGTGFGSEAQQHQVHFKQGDFFRQVDVRTLKLTAGNDGNASLSGTVPGLRAGEVEVFMSVMRNGVLSEPSNKLKFTITAPPAPRLETITPNTGLPGSSFILIGVGLDANPRNLGIFFKQGDKVIPSPVELLKVINATNDLSQPITIQGVVPRMPSGDAEVFAVVYRNGVPSEPSNKLVFKVLAPEGAKLESVDPKEGTPGTAFTIKGSGFDAEVRRNFVFLKKGERFIQLDPTTLKSDGKTFISGVVPRLMPGDYELFVLTNLDSVAATTGKLPGTPSNILPFKILPPPGAKLESIDPVEGPAGTTFTLKGSGWGTDARLFRVVFKRNDRFVMLEPASIKFDATMIVGQVPSIASAGDYDVFVVTNIDLIPGTSTVPPGVPSNILKFRVPPPPAPVLESITPTEAVPGARIKLIGKNFALGMAVIFKVGTVSNGFKPEQLQITPTSIEGILPQLPAGAGEVAVTFGEQQTNSLPFRVLAPPPVAPELISITPVDGKPGELFRLAGKNFTNDITVTFVVGTIQHIMGGARLKITETTIEAELPAMPPGDGKVWVHNAKGKSNELPFKFLAPDKPTLESIDPKEGAPGTKFTLKGLKFRKFYELFFKQGERVVCVPHNQMMSDETTMMGIVPGVPAGDYEVYIGFVGGVPFSNPLPFKVLPIANAAKLIAIDPVEGKGGTPFKLTGENLAPFYNVVFRQGTNRVDINPDGYRFENGAILGVAPNLPAGEAEVFLSIEGGAPASNILKFKFLGDTTPTPKPTLSSVTPAEGAPGTPFRLTGTNFVFGQTAYFRQGDQTVIIKPIELKYTPTTIEGVLPALVPGAAEVFVGFGDNEFTNKLSFLFLRPANLPKLDAINPTDVTPGAPFKVTGSNLAPFNDVAFKQNGKYIPAPRHLLKFTDGTMIEGVVPGLAPDVPTEVLVGYGNDTTVIASNPLPVRVLAPPQVMPEAITSTDGKPEGIPGNEFRITGRNLAPIYNIVFKQGDRTVVIEAFSYRVVDGAIIGKIPDLPANTTDVFLTLGTQQASSVILKFLIKPRS